MANTTVCSIVAQPKKYDGKLVRIKASVLSDGMDGTLLVSHDCPRGGIDLVVEREFSKVEGLSSIDEAIYRGTPGTKGKEITATFVGKFAWSPRRSPYRTLSVRNIVDLHITITASE